MEGRLHCIADCLEGGPPALAQDDEEDEGDADLEFELGDCIFIMNPPQQSEDIWASSIISQQLAEAFKQNSKPVQSSTDTHVNEEDISEYLQEFGAVFSKESFDALPNPKCWDHAVLSHLLVNILLDHRPS